MTKNNVLTVDEDKILYFIGEINNSWTKSFIDQTILCDEGFQQIL